MTDQPTQEPLIATRCVAVVTFTHDSAGTIHAVDVPLPQGSSWMEAPARDEAAEAIEDENRNPWKMALMNELVVAGILNRFHDDPKKALADAIEWNVTVALDPRVSEPAQRLQGEAAELKAKNAELVKALAFAASVIKCGEPWTATCEQIIGGALAAVGEGT